MYDNTVGFGSDVMAAVNNGKMQDTIGDIAINCNGLLEIPDTTANE